MEKELETTYYRFLSEVRAFLSKLIKDPIKAEPSKYLKDRNFNRTRLINVLRDKDVIERHEKILDSTNSEEKKAKYVVKYKVRKKDFENRIYKIYVKNFEKNLPEKEKVNECDCGGAAVGGGEGAIGGATSCGSVGADTTRGDVGYDVPMGMIYRPGYLAGRDKKKKGKEVKPENILGKDIKAEAKKTRRIFITEEQFNRLLNEEGVTSTSSVGALGDFTAGGLVLKTSDGKEDPCSRTGHIKVKTVMKEKKNV